MPQVEAPSAEPVHVSADVVHVQEVTKGDAAASTALTRRPDAAVVQCRGSWTSALFVADLDAYGDPGTV